MCGVGVISRLRRNHPIAARMHVVSCTQRWCITPGDESGITITGNLYMDTSLRYGVLSHVDATQSDSDNGTRSAAEMSG